MRKVITALMIIVVAGGIAAGCGNSGTKSPTSQSHAKPAAAKTTWTVSELEGRVQEDYQASLDKDSNALGSKVTGVTLVMEAGGKASGYANVDVPGQDVPEQVELTVTFNANRTDYIWKATPNW